MEKGLSAKDTVDIFVDDLVAEQKQIDESRAQMADEIVSGQNIQTVEEGRRFARAWIITAAQLASNEEYWRQRAMAAEGNGQGKAG